MGLERNLSRGEGLVQHVANRLRRGVPGQRNLHRLARRGVANADLRRPLLKGGEHATHVRGGVRKRGVAGRIASAGGEHLIQGDLGVVRKADRQARVRGHDALEGGRPHALWVPAHVIERREGAV